MTREALQGFVHEHSEIGSTVYTDDSTSYDGLDNHESVKHSVSEYVKRTNTHQWSREFLVDVEAWLQRS